MKIIGRSTSPRSSIGENEIFNYTNRKTMMDCPKYIPVGLGRLVVWAPGHPCHPVRPADGFHQSNRACVSRRWPAGTMLVPSLRGGSAIAGRWRPERRNPLEGGVGTYGRDCKEPRGPPTLSATSWARRKSVGCLGGSPAPSRAGLSPRPAPTPWGYDRYPGLVFAGAFFPPNSLGGGFSEKRPWQADVLGTGSLSGPSRAVPLPSGPIPML